MNSRWFIFSPVWNSHPRLAVIGMCVRGMRAITNSNSDSASLWKMPLFIPIFYKRNVNDTYVQRKKKNVDRLFKELNSYNEHIKLTLAVNQTKFLDTKLVRENREITTQFFSKSTKLPMHWKSKILVRYKHNVVTGELHRVKWIAPDFNEELKKIRQKYRNTGLLLTFINESICNFKRGREEMIIPE